MRRRGTHRGEYYFVITLQYTLEGTLSRSSTITVDGTIQAAKGTTRKQLTQNVRSHAESVASEEATKQGSRLKSGSSVVLLLSIEPN